MSSTYDNTVFDFDLDFLNEPAAAAINNAKPDPQARADKLKQSIIKLKKKIISVDECVQHSRKASIRANELEVQVTKLKEESKQHHVEIGNFIEKVTRLEKEIQAARARERLKDERNSELENRIIGLQTLQTQLKFLDIEKNKTKRTLVNERKNGKSGVLNNAKKGLVEVEIIRKENEKLRKENFRIPGLEKEIESLRKKNTDSKSVKINENNEIVTIQKLEKEIESLCKENAKISKLEKEVETLNKKNAELSKLEKENENLHKENAKISKLEKEVETLKKKNAELSKLEKENENLHKENALITKLEKEVETLNKKNAELSKLEKENENLNKENAKIPKLTKEIEILRKENAKITKLGNDENIFKQNFGIISNLEKDIETLCIKNAKIEMENRALKKEIMKIPNKEEDIEIRLTHLTSTTKEKGKLHQKNNNLTRKHKSLPDRNGEWCDRSENDNGVFEDPLLSPAPNDTIIAEKFPIAADEDIVVAHESDTDYSNDVASVDTGLGSSLANSDSDKGVYSPEYVLNDSPPNGKNIENSKANTKDAAMSRSSMLLEEIHTSTMAAVEHDKNQNVCKSKNVSHRTSHSKLLSTVNETNVAREVSTSVDTSDNVSAKKLTQSEREKECLEMNNSLRCDSHTELELGHILSTMKLNYKAVSPIPRTPIKMHEVNSTFSSSELKKKKDRCNIMCKETGVFLMQLSLRLDVDPHSVTINDCDRLIACFDSILKSKQILTECSIPNINSNIEISDGVLSHDNHNLESISCPESTTLSSEKETGLRNKKGENRLSQNESWFALQDENQSRDDQNSITMKNPSPPDMDTNILKHKQVEKGLQCLSMDESQILNHSICKELVMNNEISDVTDSVRCDNQLPIKNNLEKKAKNKKITKLGKLKKKLEPKYKIRMDKSPPRNLLNKSKQLFHIKKVTENDTSATLNKKDAYEKAVKVMAELNSQQGAKIKSPPKQTKVLLSPRHTACLEKDINSSGDSLVVRNFSSRTRRKLSDLFDTCSVVLIKDPLLFPPLKAKNSTNHKAEDNNSRTHRVLEDNSSTTDISNEDIDSTTRKAKQIISCTTHAANEDMDSTTHKAKEDNNSTTHKTKEVNNSMTHQAKENNSSKTHKIEDTQDNEICPETPSRKRRRRSSEEPLIQYKRVLRSTTINTRLSTEDNIEMRNSKGENNNKSVVGSTANEIGTHLNNENTDSKSHNAKEDYSSTTHRAKEVNNSTTHPHSAKQDNNSTTHKTKEVNNSMTHQAIIGSIENESGTQLNNENTHQCQQHDKRNSSVLNYGDLDVFSEGVQLERKMLAPVREVNMEATIQLERKTLAPVREVNMEATICHPKESILCYMLEKYGVEKVRPHEKKIPDNIVKQICEKIEQDITTIIESKDNINNINNFIDCLSKINYKHFIAGLMKFLAKPERKVELFGRIYSHTAPPMTKTEQILLYAIQQLESHWPSVDIVDAVLTNIEFTLFKLNRTPEFGVIESVSHFYAILCRYVKAKSRLRLFMLDAMYCIQFKSVPLVKQCLEVWMHIIPLSHLGIAKSPLVTCLVYLLHFYKCEDKFNRVQEIRRILRDKYNYQITDWNETKILEMFKNSIKELKDITIEKKMLRLALIILAKRHGPQWCQNNIIKNLLQPMIEKENVRNNVKEFCVSMIGPLMKPYPVDMKVHCEIAITQLMDILNKKPSPELEEAAITSMIYINRHDQRSINKTLLSRKMKPMSTALENTIRDYVKTKPLKIWKNNLATIAR